MKTYIMTQDQMERLRGAAKGGAMLGGEAAYEGCLKIGAILAEIAFKEGFDKSPGSAPEYTEFWTERDGYAVQDRKPKST